MRRHRRKVGRVTMVAAIVVMVLSLVGTVLGWETVGNGHRSVDRSLVLASDSLTTLSDTIVVARDVVNTVRQSLDTVTTSLAPVAQGVTTGGQLAGSVADLANGDLPKRLDDVAGALSRLQPAASALDRVIAVVSSFPLGPSLPNVSVATTVNDLHAAVAAIPANIRTLGDQLAQLKTTSGEVATGIDELHTNLVVLDQKVVEASGLLDRYAVTADRARSLAATTRRDLRSQSRDARLLVALFGIVLALSQLGPLWLGWWLAHDDPAEEPSDERSHESAASPSPAAPRAEQ
jgi:hypothetical protein